jgi:UDP-glucose:(glucosyl)LPS alpha-1,2-glucosyltransferase
MGGFEENEISIKANGGTELAKRDLTRLLPTGLLDNFQIICSRVRDLDVSKIRIYWVHDLPHDPECKKLADTNFRKKFHKIVYVSNWQYSQFRTVLSLPYSTNDIIIENGIEPIRPNPNKSNNQINLIYTSTPQRGLNILVPVFEYIKQHKENIHLHVFSSFNIYGWPQMDYKFQDLFDRCKDNSNITYHGFQPYQKVREQIANSHIFAYPSIWEETSCRALIEAMSAGLLCVHPNYGALPDTSGNMNLKMYQGDVDLQLHAVAFANSLSSAIDLIQKKNINNYLNSVKNYTDNRFNLAKIVKQWESLLINLSNKYDTLESRKF